MCFQGEGFAVHWLRNWLRSGHLCFAGLIVGGVVKHHVTHQQVFGLRVCGMSSIHHLVLAGGVNNDPMAA